MSETGQNPDTLPYNDRAHKAYHDKLEAELTRILAELQQAKDAYRDKRTEAEYHANEADALRAELAQVKDALERISEVQPKVLAYIRANGFVFETPLQESEGFEKLAFSIYTDLCEVDGIARAALEGTDHASD